MAIWNILEVSGGNVAPGEGSALYEVKFELLSFKPFPGQVLKGKVKSCNRSVPAASLQLPYNA